MLVAKWSDRVAFQGFQQFRQYVLTGNQWQVVGFVYVCGAVKGRVGTGGGFVLLRVWRVQNCGYFEVFGVCSG